MDFWFSFSPGYLLYLSSSQRIPFHILVKSKSAAGFLSLLKDLLSVVGLPPVFLFVMSWTRLKSPQKNYIVTGEIGRNMSMTFCIKSGSSLLGAYIFINITILSLVANSAMMNLPSGSEYCFISWKEKLLLKKNTDSCFRFEQLLKIVL